MSNRLIIILLILCLAIPGCTLKFKAKDLEIDTQTKDEITIAEYTLDEASVG